MRWVARGFYFVVLGSTLATSGCVRGPDTERELRGQLAATREQAATERQRMMLVEARLAELEQQKSYQYRQPVDTSALLQRLEQLVLLNQQLLQQVQTNARSTPSLKSHTAKLRDVPPECSGDMTTEQKIRHLVTQLRDRRSPWLVDGLTYEESQALRILLRPERPLDLRNPWQ